MTMQTTTRKAQKGMSLIEVLVAAVIIAIGLLGLAGLQTRSLQMNQSAHLRSQANYFAYEALDIMRMHRQQAKNGKFNITMSETSTGGSGLPADFVNRWTSAIDTTLPMAGSSQTGGSIQVNDTADGAIVTVTVAWLDERWNEDAANDQEKIRDVTVETEL